MARPESIACRMTKYAQEWHQVSKKKKRIYRGISNNLIKNTGVKDTAMSSSLMKKQNQFYGLSPTDNFHHVSNTKRTCGWNKAHYFLRRIYFFYTILANFWQNNKNSIPLIPYTLCYPSLISPIERIKYYHALLIGKI